MASIIQNKKNGKVVSYRPRVYLGKDSSGSFKTWKIPDGVTLSKAKKMAEKASQAWEAEVLQEQKEPKMAMKQESVVRTDFSEFAETVWYPIVVCDGQHKLTTEEFYRIILGKITSYFYGRILQDITALDLKKYFVYLRTKYKTRYGKPLSDKTVRHHYITLKQIFSFAFEQEYLEKNPMEKNRTAKKSTEAS